VTVTPVDTESFEGHHSTVLRRVKVPVVWLAQKKKKVFDVVTLRSVRNDHGGVGMRVGSYLRQGCVPGKMRPLSKQH
jgi:hypothetical protein